MNEQLDFICLRCILPSCQPEHKHCMYELEGRDAKLSQKVRGLQRAIKQLQDKLDSIENPRVHYYRKHYAKNREKKLAAANERYRRDEDRINARRRELYKLRKEQSI